MKRATISVLLAAEIAVATGCTHTALPLVSTPKVATEKEAILIARRAIADQLANPEPEIEVVSEGDRWIVVFWDRPTTLGGFTMVKVSKEGKVIAIYPGL